MCRVPRLRRSLFLLPIVLLVAPLAARAQTAPKTPRETARYVIYMQGARVGTMTESTFDETFESKPVSRLESDTSITAEFLGTKVEQSVRLTHIEGKDGKPVLSRYSIRSMGRETKIDARYEPAQVICYVDAGGQKSKKVVPIPKGVTLVGDPQLEAAAGGLKVGHKATMHFLEPMTLTIQKVDTAVVKEDKRTIGGKEVPVFQMKVANALAGTSDSWVDADGHLLEDLNPRLGIRTVREDLDTAGSASNGTSYQPPKDFAVATSVKTAVKLPDARTTRSLGLRISGVPDESLVLSDVRQRAEERRKDGDTYTVTYRIQTRELPASGLPLAKPGAAGPSLGDAIYLGTASPAIQKQAKTLAAGASDRAAVAKKIRAWVKGHMQKPNNVGTPRTAAEIMQSRDGVCRDYATLFTAVARAAGIPTRTCSGIVYFQDGFFYHAWVECQLTAGEDGWYAFDPTLGSDFVDATHVKFAQGDPAEMFNAVRVIGQIQAEILDHK